MFGRFHNLRLNQFTSSSSHVLDSGVAILVYPGQPVVDLENYMQSLEKKQLSVEKMIGKLQANQDDSCTKSFVCKKITSHVL